MLILVYTWVRVILYQYLEGTARYPEPRYPTEIGRQPACKFVKFCMGAVYGYLRPKISVKCAVLPYLDIQELKKSHLVFFYYKKGTYY